MADVDPEILALRAAMDARGYRNADLGRLLGLDSAQVTRIFQGRRRVQRHEWREIERWLGGEIAGGRPADPVAFLPGMVPLYSWFIGEPLSLEPGALLGSVAMHPAQANVRDAFALQVPDETMAPRYEPGETIYLAPNRWPRPHQDCVVVTADGLAVLRRFIGRTGGLAELLQLDPREATRIRIEDVAAVHAVVGRG